MKMHLGARPPSEGARLLARWIGEQAGGDLTLAAARLSIGANMLQRVLAGELRPGVGVGGPIWMTTGIARQEWARRPLCGWFERPASAQAA